MSALALGYHNTNIKIFISIDALAQLCMHIAATVPLRYNVALARDIFLDSRSHHARLVSSVQACYQKVALRFVYN